VGRRGSPRSHPSRRVNAERGCIGQPGERPQRSTFVPDAHVRPDGLGVAWTDDPRKATHVERLRKLAPLTALLLLPLAGCEQPTPEGETGPPPEQGDPGGGETDDVEY
jgi:hypothetical protein